MQPGNLIFKLPGGHIWKQNCRKYVHLEITILWSLIQFNKFFLHKLSWSFVLILKLNYFKFWVWSFNIYNSCILKDFYLTTKQSQQMWLQFFKYICCQFHQRFTCVFFVWNFGAKNHKAKCISYKKLVHKLLMKLTPGENITKYESFLLIIWFIADNLTLLGFYALSNSAAKIEQM